jgi:hypothetical protein
MEKVIPLLQSLVWPVSILAVIFWGRRHVVGLLEAIRTRIEAGDTLEAGTSGLKLTASGGVVRDSGPQQAIDATHLAGGSAPPVTNPVEEQKKSQSQDDQAESPGYYVVHKARRDRSLDRGDYEYYRLRIFLETDPGVDLARVKKVVYHLAEGFRKPTRTITDPDTQFELRTWAWGQFNLSADVYLMDRPKPLKLERYLNF